MSFEERFSFYKLYASCETPARFIKFWMYIIEQVYMAVFNCKGITLIYTLLLSFQYQQINWPSKDSK